ncbi:MAG: pyruvate formate lyase-activating protein, partial [Candidatus Thorarchaeota archaeon]
MQPMMWRFVRPDALRVWSNPEALKRLKRYRAILNGETTAKYLLSKTVSCDCDLEIETDELWKTHSDLSARFRKIVERHDTDKSDPGEPITNGANFLDLKIELAQRMLKDCHFCERKCGADRTRDSSGWCKLGEESRISSAFLHSGEEAPLVPSGTIFFASCCFGCVFCQNHDISTNPNTGRVVSPELLAQYAQALFRDGALNINYVGGDPIPNTHTILGSMVYQEANVTQLW